MARILAGSTPLAQQVEVAIDEHVRLAGAGRRLEHDVVRRIDRSVTRSRVGELSEKGSGGIFADPSEIPPDPFSRSSSNGSQLDVANVVLPAHGGVRAAGAHHGVGGRRRKLAAPNPVDGVEQPRLGIEQRRVPVSSRARASARTADPARTRCTPPGPAPSPARRSAADAAQCRPCRWEAAAPASCRARGSACSR